MPDGDAIIPLVNHIQPAFDLVVATQDWHPANHKSFASNHPGKTLFEQIDWQGLPQVLWPDHCVQETAGAAFASDLDWRRTEAIFRKGTDPQIDSYSGFYDNGHRKATGLAAYLNGRGVKEVYLAGLAADFCVSYTAMDSLAAGFATFLIEDATRAISNEGFEKAKRDILEKGGHLVRGHDILSA